MSKARLIITAVVVEGRTKSEVARDYQVSRYWVQQLVRRWYAEGERAYQPRSRRPRSSPQAVPAQIEEEIWPRNHPPRPSPLCTTSSHGSAATTTKCDRTGR